MAQRKAQRRNEPPILLVKWYDVTKWLLERVDSFLKNQIENIHAVPFDS